MCMVGGVCGLNGRGWMWIVVDRKKGDVSGR